MKLELRVAVWLSIALLAVGAPRAEAQAVIDELDAGNSESPSALRARFGSAPIVDVDPNEPGSRSAGLQEALGRCNGGAGGCILQLRANTTYTLPPHPTWALPIGGVEPRAAFHTNGADDVWLRGHGDGSVIRYTQVGNGADRLLRNWILSADWGSDRVLFSEFKVERTDQCSVDCQEYAMVFAMMGDVSDIVVDDVTVQGTQLDHDGGYPGRNIFMVLTIAYPGITTANTPKRVVVQNSRFSLSSSGIHSLQCDDCRFVGNQFDAEGVPDDATGARVRAFTTFKGKNYLIAKNAMDLALDGHVTTNWTGCVLMQGDQTFDPNLPQSARINEGATVIGNACTGLRQSSAAGFWFQGYRIANVTGNHIYAGQCSNNSLLSCQRREDCGTSPTLTCDRAAAKAFYFEDMAWLNANSNQGNVVRSNVFDRGTDCAVRMNSVSDVDPNSNTGNTLIGNRYRLGTIANQGFCGTGPDKWFQNTLIDNALIDDASPPVPRDRIDGVWLLSDAKCDDAAENALPIDNTAILYLASDLSRVVGTASGFGAQGEYVRIDYDTEQAGSVSASATHGKLGQWRDSRLCLYIDDPALENGGRDTLVGGENAPICRTVERCSVTGTVTPGTLALTPKGTASAKCSAIDLYAGLSSAQLASVMAAFPSDNACGVKVRARPAGQTSSLSIKLDQQPRSRTAP